MKVYIAWVTTSDGVRSALHAFASREDAEFYQKSCHRKIHSGSGDPRDDLPSAAEVFNAFVTIETLEVKEKKLP